MHPIHGSACLGANGKARKCFPNQPSADLGARGVLARHRKMVVPYACRDCGSWHLTPAERYTPNHFCACCNKQAYETEDFARLRAELRENEGSAPLRVYECPYGDGWHMTSRR